ncbi:MAG TPA: hypothetical protein VNJ12_08855 [Candidatus Dormibacteraeota bacterium]|nr:hypothetical protein [Candidatus Dormibacteraeota bacterium]
MKQPGNDRLLRVVLAFAWFDLGLLILMLPWSHLWESNALLARYPGLIPYMFSGYMRGAVSGIGLVDMIMAADALLGRRPTTVAPRN